MILQYIIVGIIIAAAVAYVIYAIVRSARRKDCNCSCGCTDCPIKNNCTKPQTPKPK